MSPLVDYESVMDLHSKQFKQGLPLTSALQDEGEKMNPERGPRSIIAPESVAMCAWPCLAVVPL